MAHYAVTEEPLTEQHQYSPKLARVIDSVLDAEECNRALATVAQLRAVRS